MIMNYTLTELQKQYTITIPLIQRDYAQGRIDRGSGSKIKSHDFISKLIDVLTTDSPALNLDFVYGYTMPVSQTQNGVRSIGRAATAHYIMAVALVSESESRVSQKLHV